MGLRWQHTIDLTTITAIEMHFSWVCLTWYHLYIHSADFERFCQVIYHVGAVLKDLTKNISAILTIS